ncbi:DUF2484 family protein [Plastorhodobacter daqingensis]|uniref:DUF2484 family protein n=1 Tax=Plastorhodobacter daqingensis TaxID=1387281 RepID=A0ABW2UH85_9RHOB
MSVAITLVLIWFLGAGALALSSLRGLSGVVWLLVVIGIPILGLVTWEHGPLSGSLLLVAGALLLCWPHLPLARRVQRWLSGPQ